MLSKDTILEQGFLDLINDLNWEFQTNSDLNGDGNSDILIRHRTAGLWYEYLLDGNQIIDSDFVEFTSDLSWQLSQ